MEFLKNKNLTDEAQILVKIEEAESGATVLEKFVMQLVESDKRPNHFVAQMRPEMEFLEMPTSPYGREVPEGM